MRYLLLLIVVLPWEPVALFCLAYLVHKSPLGRKLRIPVPSRILWVRVPQSLFGLSLRLEAPAPVSLPAPAHHVAAGD